MGQIFLSAEASGRQECLPHEFENTSHLRPQLFRLDHLDFPGAAHGVLEVGPFGASRARISFWVQREKGDARRVDSSANCRFMDCATPLLRKPAARSCRYGSAR